MTDDEQAALKRLTRFGSLDIYGDHVRALTAAYGHVAKTFGDAESMLKADVLVAVGLARGAPAPAAAQPETPAPPSGAQSGSPPAPPRASR